MCIYEGIAAGPCLRLGWGASALAHRKRLGYGPFSFIGWQIRYRVWARAVQREWTLRASQRPPSEWGKIQPDAPPVHVPRPQNMRFQGQYLDREPRLHYSSFRFYEPDIGRFINPDPIGLNGGYNLHQDAPNLLSWIDPWGLVLL